MVLWLLNTKYQGKQSMKKNYFLLFFILLANFATQTEIHQPTEKLTQQYDQKHTRQHTQEQTEQQKTAISYTLVTVLYNETNEARIQEYISCLERNREHNRIEHIHVIYDTSKDTGTTPILDYLKRDYIENSNLKQNNLGHDNLNQAHITISYVQGRVTYDYCFSLANNLYPNHRIILSNADIYFNETLELLNTYDLSTTFFALTRWNALNFEKNAPLEIFKQYKKDGTFWPEASITSQDVWIFNAPIRPFEEKDIMMGTMQCDSRIAYQAHKSGLQVLNPCLSIQCCHLHLSEIRNYDPKDRYTDYSRMMGVPWSTLEVNLIPDPLFLKKYNQNKLNRH